MRPPPSIGSHVVGESMLLRSFTQLCASWRSPLCSPSARGDLTTIPPSSWFGRPTRSNNSLSHVAIIAAQFSTALTPAMATTRLSGSKGTDGAVVVAGDYGTGTASDTLRRRVEGLGLRCLDTTTGQPVCSAALRSGEFQIVRHEGLPDGAVVVKSLVWEYYERRPEGGDGLMRRPLVVVLRLNRRVDEKRLAAALGNGRMEEEVGVGVWLMGAEAAENVSGFEMGNVPPLGHSRRMRTVVDEELWSSTMARQGGDDNDAVVFGGGGSPGYELRIRLGDLVRYGGATVAAISVPFNEQRSRKVERDETRFVAGQAKGVEKEAMSRASSTSSRYSRAEVDLGFPTGAALRKAATKADGAEEVQALLERCEMLGGVGDEVTAILNSGTDASGKTALHLAAWRGSVETVRLLLNAGANIDAYSTGQGNYGKTALFYALTRCRDEVVTLLVQRGADVLICNNKGQTPRSIAVSHVSEATLEIIEGAEVAQEAGGRQWRNFRETHSDGKSYGDLDPRFGLDAANGWAPGSDELPLEGVKSVRPTSREERAARNANNRTPAQLETKPTTAVDSSPATLPFLNTASNYCHLVGIVTSKRRVGRALAFVNIVPPPDPECPEQCAPFLAGSACASGAPKFAWRCGGGGAVAVQLIIGRTAKQRLGLEGAAEAIKQLKVGQLVHVVGRIGVNGDRGVSNLRDNSTVDVVTSEVRVLQENYRVAPQSPLHDDDRGARQINPPSGVSSDGSRSTKKGYSAPASVDNTSAAKDPLVLRDVWPVIGTEKLDGDSSSVESKRGSRVVVVESVSVVRDLGEALMRETVGYSSHCTTKAAVSSCIGLDCEWLPGPKGGKASSVALLQLATPTTAYLLDLQLLCRPWLPYDAHMDEAEAAVDAALRPVFNDSRLSFVGFGIAGDLAKLARSFPHMPCFRAVAAAVEIRTLLCLAFPHSKQFPQAVGLSQLCERLFGRRLNKAQQCSDWSSRPLGPEQLEYAALDAAVLLALFTKLAEEPPVCNCETGKCVQRCVFSEELVRRGVTLRKPWAATA